MQEGIIKEYKELKQEVKVLKFKLNRLSNKFSSNQQQWVKTLKEMQKPSDDSELRPDCGESSETDVSVLVIMLHFGKENMKYIYIISIIDLRQ